MKEFVAKVGEHAHDQNEGEDSLSRKCAVLNEKLDALLTALSEESEASSSVQTVRYFLIVSQVELPKFRSLFKMKMLVYIL